MATARLCRSDRSRRISTEKELLDRDAVGFIEVDKLAQRLLDGEETFGKVNQRSF